MYIRKYEHLTVFTRHIQITYIHSCSLLCMDNAMFDSIAWSDRSSRLGKGPPKMMGMGSTVQDFVERDR